MVDLKSKTAKNKTLLDQYKGSDERIRVVVNREKPKASIKIKESDLSDNSPISQTVSDIIESGIKANASDIHIEPRENFIVVRYRIDGLLREADQLSSEQLGLLIGRIKMLGGLKLSQRHAPQGGSFEIEVGSLTYALSISTIPTLNGEKAVMRILNISGKAFSFKELGFWGSALANIQNAIVQPYGLILVVGPNGSGKLTTLFSALSLLNKPGVKIATVEDIIEHRITNVDQTQTNPQAGITFSSGLRTVLSKDPDVVMIGNLPDLETADLAVQVALRDCLVFSTLHTRNAAVSFRRLIDMGVQPFLVASTVRAVIAQRTVRRLCTKCREKFSPDNATLKHLENTMQIGTKYTIKHIHELETLALRENIGTGDMATTETSFIHMWKAKIGGCDGCNHTGYRGRIGIYEVLNNSAEIQSLIVALSSIEVIEKAAIDYGMITMKLDGLVKVLRGLTTIDEVLRVTAQ